MSLQRQPRSYRPCRRFSILTAGAAIGILIESAGGGQRLGTTALQPARTSSDASVAEGDAHYARRSEGSLSDRAESREILAAIAAYERASQSPDSAEGRWKLARALYFQGAYTGLDADARRAVFEKARRVSQEAIAILARRVGNRETFRRLPHARIAQSLRADPDAAPTFFWASVSWGEWSLSVGKVAAARTGAASRIRDDASIVIALDPEFEEGGGYRILGRLHDQAPRLPILTGWVSRQDALWNLRRAVKVAPRNLVNLHFLAEALARGGSAERAEAIRIEEQVVAAAPSPNHLVEEVHIQQEAKKNLASWKP